MHHPGLDLEGFENFVFGDVGFEERGFEGLGFGI